MGMIISFGWTTPALVAGHKTVTRRDWKPQHAAKFKSGMVVDAWNTSPRNTHMNPHKVATIRLTADPYIESSADFYPDEEAEGFWWLMQNGHGETVGNISEAWLSKPHPLYVVRFEVVEVTT